MLVTDASRHTESLIKWTAERHETNEIENKEAKRIDNDTIGFLSIHSAQCLTNQKI